MSYFAGYGNHRYKIESLVGNVINEQESGLDNDYDNYIVDSNAFNKKKKFDVLGHRLGSLGYGGLTGDLNQRIANVQREIKECIGSARSSVREEIAKNNRDLVLLALVNFLGGR